MVKVLIPSRILAIIIISPDAVWGYIGFGCVCKALVNAITQKRMRRLPWNFASIFISICRGSLFSGELVRLFMSD